MDTKRTLSEIAKDILTAWKKPSPYAMPYLKAMLTINSSDPNAAYYADSARSLVVYFLANASTFRGEEARRLKAEIHANYDC